MSEKNPIHDNMNRAVFEKTKCRRGSILVEAVIGSAVFLTVLLALVSAFTTAVKTAAGNTEKIQAAFLAEEGMEIIRLLRDNGWSANIASHPSGEVFYLSFDGTAWQATSANGYIDGKFERKASLHDVYRDGSKNIVSSGGSLDAETKRAAVSISWLSAGATTTKSLETYLTNIFKN